LNKEALIVPEQKTVLHVGCGAYERTKLHPEFIRHAWQEIRLDIDPDVAPDIVASITDMHPVQDHSVDAIFSSHNLEHLYPHEVPVALREFRRVLRSDGFALITLPDLQEVARLVAEDRLEEPAYLSPMGPIAPLDILYGFRPSLAKGNTFMSHRTGFTGRTLSACLLQAGFAATLVQRHLSAFSLWAIGFSSAQTEQQFAAAHERFLPLKRPQ
jgi:SAM-dependent methyltransferase